MEPDCEKDESCTNSNGSIMGCSCPETQRLASFNCRTHDIELGGGVSEVEAAVEGRRVRVAASTVLAVGHDGVLVLGAQVFFL